MIELCPENVVDWLRAGGRLAAEVPARAATLAWGVSNVVMRIHPESGDDLVIKQSRAQLRTQADWFSRLDRVYREADVLRVLAEVLPAGVVPRVLFEDRANYVLAMEAVSADHVVWKAELLAGRADASIARAAGRVLAGVHRGTWGRSDLAERFGDATVFDELRIDPFYRRIAAVHPDVAPAIRELIDQMAGTRLCLVHADFSPKNILIVDDGGGSSVELQYPAEAAPRRISVVDYETAHWGDPAFDLGFFLSHLLLKTVLHAANCEPFPTLIDAFLEHYAAEIADAGSTPGPGTADVFARTVPHLAACMLSRVDGKSPVDYLPAVSQQNRVRSYCRELLLHRPATLDEALESFRGWRA